MTVTRPVLVVEDDPETAEEIVAVLSADGFECRAVSTFADGLAAGLSGAFGLAVVDRMLPGGDGVDAVAALRARGLTLPVLMVSALGRSSNRIEGLDRGADDYLAKPFDPAELTARVRALVRRSAAAVGDDELLRFGDLEIRFKARTVHRAGRHVPLSPKEFELVTVFSRNAGSVLTRKMLLETVWKLHFDPQTNVVDVHVGRLRRKLEAGGLPPVIHTARGEGYVFGLEPPADEPPRRPA
jgi:two-component system OmpR family response regulator